MPQIKNVTKNDFEIEKKLDTKCEKQRGGKRE